MDWSDADGGSLTRCGHCDNCTRSPDSISMRDVTLESWQILKVLESITRDGGRVTMPMLADITRGVKWVGKARFTVDLDNLIGGKITMNRDVRDTRTSDICTLMT
jgi:ATP-dependent DNA helicase Q1